MDCSIWILPALITSTMWSPSHQLNPHNSQFASNTQKPHACSDPPQSQPNNKQHPWITDAMNRWWNLTSSSAPLSWTILPKNIQSTSWSHGRYHVHNHDSPYLEHSVQPNSHSKPPSSISCHLSIPLIPNRPPNNNNNHLSLTSHHHTPQTTVHPSQSQNLETQSPTSPGDSLLDWWLMRPKPVKIQSKQTPNRGHRRKTKINLTLCQNNSFTLKFHYTSISIFSLYM